jgi:hypothetical protein
MSKFKAVLAISVVLNVGAAMAIAAPLAMGAEGTVHHCLSQGHATAILAILKAAAGPQFEADFELGPNGYKDAHLKGTWIHKAPIDECASGMKGSTTAEFLGDWQHTP